MPSSNSQIHFDSLLDLAEFIAAMEDARCTSHFIVTHECHPSIPGGFIWLLNFSGGN